MGLPVLLYALLKSARTKQTFCLCPYSFPCCWQEQKLKMWMPVLPVGIKVGAILPLLQVCLQAWLQKVKKNRFLRSCLEIANCEWMFYNVLSHFNLFYSTSFSYHFKWLYVVSFMLYLIFILLYTNFPFWFFVVFYVYIQHPCEREHLHSMCLWT